MKQMIRRFSELVSRNNLFLSSQEVLRKMIFGLDTRNRQLLVLADTGAAFEEQVIPLRVIQACTVRKQYRGIRPGALQPDHLAEFLDSVELRLDIGGSDPLVLPFYEHGPDPQKAARPAERKAHLWAGAIEQMLKAGKLRPAPPDAESAVNGR
ncbi:MAG: hypothetical protein EOO11_03220 [Chitinophagaceae bacterium]|nr:MAG: hypothetical protein EOO11_03220 [Chitinophagaceae bacterium]